MFGGIQLTFPHVNFYYGGLATYCLEMCFASYCRASYSLEAHSDTGHVTCHNQRVPSLLNRSFTLGQISL